MWRLASILLLAACATAPDAPRVSSGSVSPRAVTLFADNVTARMSDGALCTAVREGRSGPWSATLSGCPHRWPVAVLRPSSRPRLPLVRSDADPWVTLGAPTGPLGFAPPR
ncbi:hypothetical protein PARPLA_02495 [Rhodobacteraceae bacterium THAF1]|uniref:hypothetical protein n=1 Tax=Palleronia sp. THAF1 TaxID=2587842 RepID=UPI000F3CAC39|nr:hypothetical protein [Palleronia sp. THAF1]QFU07975.1 hypothetical protein FIU81_04750 [Palleronia sp. THAF1]VDC27826.1 hypothetical protein PARPLA_02495 [Rhodobacteraceae bacterium THAF1]